jgi:hypothetical protein
MKKPWWHICLKILAALGALIFCIVASRRSIDFSVYHHAIRGVFDGTRPMYGNQSGVGWPMHFRNPPFFAMIFVPLSWMPMQLSFVLWTAGKFAALYALCRSLARRMSWSPDILVRAVPVLLVLPYLIQEFRYGNVQFFVFALTAAGLLALPRNPNLSALSLALAISIKVWPIFFLPYLWVRRESSVVLRTLALTALLTLSPAALLGFKGNLNLLRQWANQEFSVQAGSGEIWYPGQSVRNVLTRYLTEVDYSKVLDANYPRINVAAFDAGMVQKMGLGLTLLLYLGFLATTALAGRRDGLKQHALAFCSLALLEPFTHRIALVILLWPAMVAGAEILGAEAVPRWTWWLVYCATVLVIGQPLVPGSSAHRWMQACGFDFWAVCLLSAALACALAAEKRAPS